MNITMTENEFINDEIRVWGFDIIESLLDRGFTPIRTTVGWKWWVPPVDSLDKNADTTNKQPASSNR